MAIEKNQNDQDKEKERLEAEKRVNQQILQERANAERARAEAQAARQGAENLKGRMAALEQQIAAVKGKEDAAKSVDLPDIPDEEASIESLASYARRAKKILADQAAELAELRQTVTKTRQDRDQEEAAKKQARYADQVLEEVCTAFDEEYGAEHRNAALKRMSEINAKEGMPQTPHKAMLRLRSCYAEVAKSAKETKSDKPRTPSDPGRGGTRPSFKDPEIKRGSLDEVAAQFGAT